MKNLKNKLSNIRIAQLIIVALMFITGAILYSYLPDMIPSHWNVNNEVDNWMPKNIGVWMMPAIALLMIILFPLLQRIDPKKENYEKFKKAWEVIQLTLVIFFAHMYAVTMYISLHIEQSYLVGRLVTFGIGAMFVILGNYMGKVRHNYFVGLRTPWTLADPEVWQKSQRFSGWMFVLGGLLMILNSILWISPFYVLMIIIAMIVVLPTFYSYWISRK
ncbi:SdpI family protein [Patescibacteria group bacterium]|nr:SdpI family protein [Patescibacteria group bacterium]